VTNSFATTATDGMDLRHRDRCITDRLEAMPDTSQRTLAASVGLVTAGSMVANICAYLVHVPAGRWLGASAYGEFAVLMAAMLVLAVPALALQAVVARDTVHGRPVGELIRLTVLVTVVVAALMVPAVPLFMWLADTGFATTVAGLAAAPILVLIAGVQGLLQGRRDFPALATVLAGVGILRSVPVVIALAFGGGAGTALAAGTAGAVVAAGAAWFVVRAGISRMRTSADGSGTGTGALSVIRASQVQFVLVVAVSLDLLVSRGVLGADDAGVYALGAVATKAAFWLPQAIGVVFYPALADPTTSRRSLGRAVRVVALVGAVLTVGAGIAGPLVPLVFSGEYRPLVPILWIFAFTGSMLAVLQVTLLWAIARDRTRVALVAWVALAVEGVLVVTIADTVLGLALVAASTATAATGVTVLWVWRSHLGADTVAAPEVPAQSVATTGAGSSSDDSRRSQ